MLMKKEKWLKSEKFLGETIYFRKKWDGWVRCFIGSKKNYSLDAPNKVEAFQMAKRYIYEQDHADWEADEMMKKHGF